MKKRYDEMCQIDFSDVSNAINQIFGNSFGNSETDDSACPMQNATIKPEFGEISSNNISVEECDGGVSIATNGMSIQLPQYVINAIVNHAETMEQSNV